MPITAAIGMRSAGACRVLRFRYHILAFILVSLMVSNALNGYWVEDFWEHAAVVRELAARPWSPQHPQMLLNTPHAFYSPYSLTAALISRVTSLPPITALAFMGIVNLLFFLIALRWFVLSLVKHSGQGEAASFYALLLILVFWGYEPWSWSAFFHLNVLGHVLPYPSTFATAMALSGFSIEMRRLENGSAWLILPVSAAAALIVLSHPTTMIFFLVVLFSLHLDHLRRLGPPRWPGITAALLLAFFAAQAWPYFPFMDLFGNESYKFHAATSSLYKNILTRTWPCIAALPIIALRLKRNRLDPLAVSLLGMAVIYLYGGLTGQWAYGRIISFMVMIAHVSLAAWLAHLETSWSAAAVRSKIFFAALAGLIIWRVAVFLPALQKSLPGQTAGNAERYSFLSHYVGASDVVLADIDTSWMIPAFAGRVVASKHPVYWVEDIKKRRNDLAVFFNPSATDTQRRDIIRTYDAKFLLLDKENLPPNVAPEKFLPRYGKVIYDDGVNTLIRLEKSSG